MELYKEYMYHNTMCGILNNIILNTSKHPRLEEYLKLYLQTDKGKIELNSKDNNGETPLMIFSKRSRDISSIETVKISIEHGADVNLKNKDNETALILAIHYLYF